MKQDTIIKQPLKDSKEGLHTQGEWYVSSVLHIDKNMCPVPYHEIGVRDGDKSSWWLATVNASENAFSLEESKANAELIVKAVNERKALLDKNKELKQLAKECLFIFGNEANYPEGTRGHQIAQKCRELQ